MSVVYVRILGIKIKKGVDNMSNSVFERMPSKADSLYIKCPVDNYWYYHNHAEFCNAEHSETQYR